MKIDTLIKFEFNSPFFLEYNSSLNYGFNAILFFSLFIFFHYSLHLVDIIYLLRLLLRNLNQI